MSFLFLQAMDAQPHHVKIVDASGVATGDRFQFGEDEMNPI
jgi:hypothetical protein